MQRRRLPSLPPSCPSGARRWACSRCRLGRPPDSGEAASCVTRPIGATHWSVPTRRFARAGDDARSDSAPTVIAGCGITAPIDRRRRTRAPNTPTPLNGWAKQPLVADSGTIHRRAVTRCPFRTERVHPFWTWRCATRYGPRTPSTDYTRRMPFGAIRRDTVSEADRSFLSRPAWGRLNPKCINPCQALDRQ